MDAFLAPIPLAVLIIMIAGGLWGRTLEKRDWNGGVCPCGTKWRSFCLDSSGGRGYSCPSCDKTIRVTWWGIDKSAPMEAE